MAELDAADRDRLRRDQFAYVVEQDAGKILGYVINSTNGKLTPIPGSPFGVRRSGVRSSGFGVRQWG